MTQKSLNDCADPRKPNDINLDPDIQNCQVDQQVKDCDGVDQGTFFKDSKAVGLETDSTFKKYDLGRANYCDPMMTGQLQDDPTDPPLMPDRTVVNRYTQGLRAADIATKDLFNNVTVRDDYGKIFPVPIIWGSQERAVDFILNENVRKDNTGVIDRIRLPAMSIYTSSYEFTKDRYIYHYALNYKRTGQQLFDSQGNKIGNPAGPPGVTQQERRPGDTVLGFARGIPVNLGYTLTVWTLYWNDMAQILDQVARKFSPIAYIKVQGVTDWETIVKLDSVTNNLDTEPGDKNARVFKFAIGLTTETFIPQPLVRRKSVLKTKISVTNTVDDSDIQEIIERIDQAVQDL